MTEPDEQPVEQYEKEPVWPDERPVLSWKHVALWAVGWSEEQYHPVPDEEIEMEATPRMWTGGGPPYARSSPLLVPVWIRWLVALVYYTPQLLYLEVLRRV